MENLLLRTWGNSDSKSIENPTLADVIESTTIFRGGPGEFGIFRNDASGSLQVILAIESDKDLYLPALCFPDGRKLYYKNHNADDSWVEFSVHESPTELLTDDFDLIVGMIKEFYEAGTVKDLNHEYDFTKSDRV